MDNPSMKKYRFGDDIIEVSSDYSLEDVRTAWSKTYPSLENATTLTNSDGIVEFHVSGGEKAVFFK